MARSKDNGYNNISSVIPKVEWRVKYKQTLPLGREGNSDRPSAQKRSYQSKVISYKYIKSIIIWCILRGKLKHEV